MANVQLLEIARQRRLNALASLGSGKASRYSDRMVSIFDGVFDMPSEMRAQTARNNVVAFHSARRQQSTAADTAAPERIAA